MEQNPAAATLWRMWVDTKRRIVSFHEERTASCWSSAATRCFELRGPIRLQAIPLSMTLRGSFSSISRRLQPPKEAF